MIELTLVIGPSPR